METLDILTSIINFCRGDFDPEFDKFDMLSICFGSLADIDAFESTITYAGQDEHYSKGLLTLYKAVVQFSHPVEWEKLLKRCKYSGISIVPLYDECTKEDTLVCILEFEQPKGFLY